MDTQWSRYQVFLQEKEGEPYKDVGSVHAPDPELALLNARDVFVRRPECAGLWVLPASAIYSRTAQELAEKGFGEGGAGTMEGSSSQETYLVFNKQMAAGTQTLVGEVQASSPAQALQMAVECFTGPKPPFAWWVFPARLTEKSQPQDAESMFAPARHKPFRMATDFHTLTAMRAIKSKD